MTLILLDPYKIVPPFGNHATLTDNLASYWKLDSGGGVRVDSHGGNHLTDNNSVLSAAGKLGLSAQMVSASSQYLSIPDANQVGLDITGNLTVSAWVYVDTFSTWGIVAKYNNAGDNLSYMLYVIPDGRAVFIVSSDGSATVNIASNVFGSLSTATWYFLVGRYDGTNLKLRVNATDETPVAYSSGIFSGAAEFRISGFNTGNYFNGRTDEVGVWSADKTDSDLSDLYNSGAGKTY